MSKLPDPFVQGLSSGWKVHDARFLSDSTLTCDVVIIGSGAGGGITAELLTQAKPMPPFTRKGALVSPWTGPSPSFRDDAWVAPRW
jgi:acetyl esterase/lipase